MEISSLEKEEMTKFLQKESISKITKRFNSFSDFDLLTHWHGNHISMEFQGRCYFYGEYFMESQVKYMKEVFQKYLDELGYS